MLILWSLKVLMNTFENQGMGIGCIGKLGHLSGSLQHYLLKSEQHILSNMLTTKKLVDVSLICHCHTKGMMSESAGHLSFGKVGYLPVLLLV